MKNTIIISPSKEMRDFDLQGNPYELSKETLKIISTLKKFNKEEIKTIFNVSDKIANETFNRYKNFFNEEKTPSIFMYNGMCFKHISPATLTDNELNFINNNLYILSALYGVLRPLDEICKYRLDFSINIENLNLKTIWEKIYTNNLKKYDIIINLASKEFSSLIDRKECNIIDILFVTNKNGKYKQLSTQSKILRGEMVRYLTKIQSLEISDIKKFKYENFKYNENMSDDKTIIFSSN